MTGSSIVRFVYSSILSTVFIFDIESERSNIFAEQNRYLGFGIGAALGSKIEGNGHVQRIRNDQTHHTLVHMSER